MQGRLDQMAMPPLLELRGRIVTKAIARRPLPAQPGARSWYCDRDKRHPFSRYDRAPA